MPRKILKVDSQNNNSLLKMGLFKMTWFIVWFCHGNKADQYDISLVRNIPTLLTASVGRAAVDFVFLCSLSWMTRSANDAESPVSPPNPVAVVTQWLSCIIILKHFYGKIQSRKGDFPCPRKCKKTHKNLDFFLLYIRGL